MTLTASALVTGCTSTPVAPGSAATAGPAVPTASTALAASPRASAAVTVEDLDLSGSARTAYLVKPGDAAPGSAAGILWFHWLETGAPTSNRTEFLDEAKQLATRGVVSVLVDGTFPWLEDPESIAHDTAALDADLAMVRTAYEALHSQPEVDPARTALVGHDFGSMYDSVVFAADPRPVALVMMAPTARWADWFARYWVISDDVDAYKAALAPYDPVTVLRHAGGRPILLQFAVNDRYIPADVAEEISAAAGDSAETKSYDATHELNDAAREDRDAWLGKRLGFETR